MKKLKFDFSKRLRELRTVRGLTQEQLAVKAGVSSDQISRIERGLHDPSLTMIIRLAFGLDVSVSDLFREN